MYDSCIKTIYRAIVHNRLNVYNKWTFDKSIKIIRWGKDGLFNK